jgi:hypothetical protein
MSASERLQGGLIQNGSIQINDDGAPSQPFPRGFPTTSPAAAGAAIQVNTSPMMRDPQQELITAAMREPFAEPFRLRY